MTVQNLVLKKSTESKKCWKFPIAAYWFFLSYLLWATWHCYYCQMVTSYGQYQQMWRLHSLVGRSMVTPCCSAQEETLFPGLRQTPSTPLLSEADVVWIWCVLSPGLALLHSGLDFHTPTLLPTLFKSRMWNDVFAMAGAWLSRCLSRF